MKDVVLIPCWQRAELLWHTLEHIKRAEGADQLHYIFRFDQGYSQDLNAVVTPFPFSYEIAVTPRSHYKHAKQSYSVLSGYKLATERTGGLVFLIEEDIFVATDFFKWHRAVHEQNPDLFCSIGVENHNRRLVDEGDMEEYYLSTLDYCSWGVCYTAERLVKTVLPHATFTYFLNPLDYIRRTLKGSPIGDNFTEQDGLIRRIQWKEGFDAPIAYPYQPRAYHAGVYGYNRGRMPSGTLQQRIDHVTSFAYSHEAMRTLAARPEWADDSKPFDLNASPWTQQRLKPLNLDHNGLKL